MHVLACVVGLQSLLVSVTSALEIYPCESSLEAVPCIVAAMGGAVFLHLVPKTWSCFWFRFRV